MSKSPLSNGGVLSRVALTCGIVLALLGLRYINPETVAWFPLRTSCGAFTGLPCIFCGTTRAIHHLLTGDFARALYFNWLAFPAVLAAIGLAAVSIAELVAGRHLIVATIAFRVTPKGLAWTGAALVVLWLLQVSLAVEFHKHELLNPAGPLYALFVR